MVEPAAAVIFNTLLSGRSALGHPVYSVSRVMSRPARVSLNVGFFNPQPRRVKGKEKMAAPSRPEVLAVYSSRCQEWSCRMRVSIWCLESEHKSAEELNPRWPRSPRRTRKAAHNSPRIKLVPPLHRGQTRHASNSSDSSAPDDSESPSFNSDGPAPRPPTEASTSSNTGILDSEAPSDDSDTDGLVVPPSEAPDPSDPPLLDNISETDSPPSLEIHLQPLEDAEYIISPADRVSVWKFLTPPPIPVVKDDAAHLSDEVAVGRLRELLIDASQKRREKHPKLEQTWRAYEAVETRGCLSFFTPPELLFLCDKWLDFAETHYQVGDLDFLHMWGTRLGGLLETLRLRVPSVDLAMRNSIARAMALEGDVQKSLDFVHTELPEYKRSAPDRLLQVYESVLLSTWRHYDRLRALDFLILEWKIVGPHIITETSRNHPKAVIASGTSLRQNAHAIVSGISLPALVLADKKHEWDKQRCTQLGELLIEAFFRAKLPVESLDIMREMTRQGIRPAVHLPLQLVRVLAREDLYIDAHQLYTTLASATDETYEYLFTGLYLHAHEGDHLKAKAYYNRIVAAVGWAHRRDVLQLMYSFAVQGKTQETRQVFEEFFPADSNGIPTNSPQIDHYAVGIFSHAQRADFGGTQPWVESMAKLGLVPEVYVYTTILKSFALRGDLEPINIMLNQMRAAGVPPNLITYTTIMTLMAHRKDPVSVEALYKRAVNDGVVPDRIMMSTVMNAHIQAASWKGVIRAFDFVKSTSPHLGISISIYNLLLKAYVHIGAPFRIVSHIFNQLERYRVRPDAFTFALLIQSACDERKMHVAQDIFTEMEKLAEYWGSNRHITTWTLTIIMTGYLRMGNKVQAKATYDEMKRRNLEPNAVTYGAILTAYGREGTEESFKIAEEFIQDLTSRPKEEQTWDTPPHGHLSARDYIYLPLLRGYSMRRKTEDVERLFQEMLNQNGEPTLGMLTTLLEAYARVRDIDGVRQLWPQLLDLGVQYSKVPVFEEESQDQALSRMHTFVLCHPLSLYIKVLSGAGLFHDIAAVWKEFQMLGFSFSSDNWNQLSLALLRAGEVERAFAVLEKVLIPYHERSNRLRLERDPNPDSPLSIVDLPDTDQRPMERPLMGKARSNATKWGKHRRRAAKDFDDPEYADDLGHHLHILHRISPWANTWLPHPAVLHGLLNVLLRLRAGYAADAERHDRSELTFDNEELVHQRVASARQHLADIYAQYPEAVTVVNKFEMRERQRLGRWFTRLYPWAGP
ncbi:hypothetical protein C8J57DRAFT_1294328 [Mycena rebaudengoi]|nr:hypothetical protein C8J57DRAFT_1294328 [Mycena rebaudengoi]